MPYQYATSRRCLLDLHLALTVSDASGGQRKSFVDGRLDRAAGHGSAARDVDRVANGGGAHRVPRRRHRCMRLPAVGLRIVTLHLPEYGALRNLASIRDAVFAAHGEEAV